MSLSSLFDVSQPTDFLRSALNMLTEYEQAKEENDRPKMVPPAFCLLLAYAYAYASFSVCGNDPQNGTQGWA
jgi:hypothetical protein